MRRSPAAAVIFFALCAAAPWTVPISFAAEKPAKQSAMQRSEYHWKAGADSSTFGVLRSGADIKMIQEEMKTADGATVKNEWFFNNGALLQYMSHRDAAGKTPPASLMMTFDKSGKMLLSRKMVDGKKGQATEADAAQARKHLSELMEIVRKAQ